MAKCLYLWYHRKLPKTCGHLSFWNFLETLLNDFRKNMWTAFPSNIWTVYFCVKAINLFKVLRGASILATWISHQPTWYCFLPIMKYMYRESLRLPTGFCIHTHLPSNLQLAKEVLISWQKHLNREYRVGWGGGKVSSGSLFT